VCFENCLNAICGGSFAKNGADFKFSRIGHFRCMNPLHCFAWRHASFTKEKLCLAVIGSSVTGFNMKSFGNGISAYRRLLPLLTILFLPALAQAHPGVPGHAHGFAGGLTHPFSGMDHVCAMIAVGLWAAQRGGRALWLVPVVFVSVMALGGVLDMGKIPVPLVEQGIAASVLVLGILIAAAVRLPLVTCAMLVGVFALFHGYAHGAEMPGSASGLNYDLGFVAATAGLHLLGIGLGLLAGKFGSARLVRYAGGAIAVCGVYLCLAV
jgi:urease accessory protein